MVITESSVSRGGGNVVKQLRYDTCGVREHSETLAGHGSAPFRATQGSVLRGVAHREVSNEQLPSFRLAPKRKLDAVGRVQPQSAAMHADGSETLAYVSNVADNASMQPLKVSSIRGGSSGGFGGLGGKGGFGLGGGGEGGGAGEMQGEVKAVELTSGLHPPSQSPSAEQTATMTVYRFPQTRSSMLSCWWMPSGSKGTRRSSTKASSIVTRRLIAAACAWSLTNRSTINPPWPFGSTIMLSTCFGTCVGGNSGGGGDGGDDGGDIGGGGDGGGEGGGRGGAGGGFGGGGGLGGQRGSLGPLLQAKFWSTCSTHW